MAPKNSKGQTDNLKTPTQANFQVPSVPIPPVPAVLGGHVGVSAGVSGLGSATHVDVQPSTLNNAKDGDKVNKKNEEGKEDRLGPLPVISASPRKKAGTSMSSQGGAGEAGRGLADWIRDDIKITKRTRVHFMDFLKCMLMRCAVDQGADPTETLQKVVETTTRVYNSEKFSDGRKSLDEYCKITSETAGYEPLTSCFNLAFRLLEKARIPELTDKLPFYDLEFHDNADQTIDHYYRFCRKSSNLKPDLYLATNRLSGSLDKEKGEKVQWPDTPGIAELKIQGRKGFSEQRSGEYPVVLAKDVKEYRVLPDKEIDRDDKCASATFLASSPEEALVHPKDRTDSEVRMLSSCSSTSARRSRSSRASSRTNESASGRVLRSNGKRGPPLSPPETNDDAHPAKRPHLEDKLMPTEQVSLYALEMLCRGVYSLHALNLIIVDDLVWVWWCDRQNVIQTTGLNFIQDLPYFMVLLALFRRFTLTQWGVEPSLVSKESKFIIQQDSSESVDVALDAGGGKEIVASIYHPAVDDLHYRGLVLKGGATCLLNAISPSMPGKVLAIKMSWPETRRASKYMLINAATDALKGLEVSKHLPKLIGWKDVPSTSTGKIIEELKKIGCDAGTFPDQNPRNLRMLLFRRLDPLDKIGDVDIFMKAWVDCFKCHYALWTKGIQHGDISVWNLMWDSDGKCGILNDFDLAMVKGSNQYRGGERTGTLPFMSRRILGNKDGSELGEKMYADELESFTWVLLWLSLREADSIPEGADWRKTPVIPESADWRSVNTFEEVSSRKADFVTRHQSFDSYASYPRAWNKCKLLLELLDIVATINKKWKHYHQTGEPYLEDISLEVVKIMEDDFYELEDLTEFWHVIDKRLEVVYENFSKARKAAKAKKLLTTA